MMVVSFTWRVAIHESARAPTDSSKLGATAKALIHVAGDALAPSILDNWRTVMDSRQAQRRTRALPLLMLGYIERRDDRDDRRSTRIFLMALGKAVVVTIREAVMEVERD